MYKKHLSAGRILDSSTFVRIPISPFGRLFSKPLAHVQMGGQLGTPDSGKADGGGAA